MIAIDVPQVSRSEIYGAVVEELEGAYFKHGREKWGRHEFYAILREEVDEVWDSIKSDAPIERVIPEIIQIMAVCMRYLESGDRYGFQGKARTR